MTAVALAFALAVLCFYFGGAFGMWLANRTTDKFARQAQRSADLAAVYLAELQAMDHELGDAWAEIEHLQALLHLSPDV